jgi:ABC-type sugar transport system permease subunit
MLNPSMGFVNRFLKAVGLGTLAIDWLGKPSTAIWCVIASSQWQFVGYTAMLFVVAIQRIPDDFYEAAKIDGATSLQSFFYITLPNVKEMILLNLTTTLIGAFKVFDEVYIRGTGAVLGGHGNAALPDRIPGGRHGLRLGHRSGDLRDYLCAVHRADPHVQHGK